MRDNYNGGKWTQARFNGFVKSALRSASRRWPPKYEVLNAACVGQLVNVKTGRLAKHYTCATCQALYPAKEVQVDHISAIIDPEVGFVDWDSVVHNLFCEADNLQVLCKECHSLKTKSEKEISANRKRMGKVRNDRTRVVVSEQIEKVETTVSREAEGIPRQMGEG